MISGFDRMLLLLSAAAAFVLLIACANVSSLLLAQSLHQEAEVAVRTALGATRGRLIRQYLTYSVLLALMGGALGALLALWTVEPLVSLSPLYGLGEFDIEPRADLATFGFTFLVSLAVGVLFGLIPALKVSKVTLSRSLRESGRSRSLTRGGRRLLDALVVAELALALMLLVGAGLMSRSLRQLEGEDRGFDRGHLLTFAVPLSEARFPGRERKVAFLRELTRGLRSLPGVVSAGGTTVQPLDPGTTASFFNVEGHPPAEERGYHIAHGRTITPGYLEALKIPLLAGRYFTEHDGGNDGDGDDRRHDHNNGNAPRSAIVSKSLADRYWPGESAIGKRVKRGLYGSERPWLTVVGVVGTLKEKQDEVVTTSDALYLFYAQPIRADLDQMTFVLRTRGEPASLLPAVRQTIRGIDRDVPVYDVATMEQRFRRRTTTERFSAGLYGLLGLLGLALAAFGIYAVLAFSVNQRLRELGIRAALGARPADIRALIVHNGLRLTALGLALGAAGSLVLTHFLSSQLYQTDPRDPLVLIGALTCLTVIAIYSCYIPAQRAAGIDPILALRSD
jgi:predicted permease